MGASVVTWNSQGGIATKNAPLMVQPGSALLLDNVRQERMNEWRTRPGTGHDEADDLPDGNVPVMLTEAPWGGFVGLCRETIFETAGRVYSPTPGTRWILPPADTNGAAACSQLTPGLWSRTPVGPVPGPDDFNPAQVSTAQGTGYRLSAWWLNYAGNIGIQVALQTIDGATVQSWNTFNSDTAAQRPCCVYSSAAGMLVLVYVNGANEVIADCWSTNTGAHVQTKTISANAYAGAARSAYLQAIYYGGATVTIAFRNNTGTGNLEIAEYNVSANTVVSYPQAVDASLALTLFPDPDASGIRMVGIGTAVPELRVIRLNSVGVIQTNALVAAVDPINISGVAYNAGADWMLVFGGGASNRLQAIKKRGGVISSPVDIVPANRLRPDLVTGAWREPGTDAMRYIVNVTGAAAIDAQPTYLEMALEFENGVNIITNGWTEPQAKILPLNAGTVPGRGALTQVQRLGTDNYLTALARITQLSVASDGFGGPQFAIDAWTVQYLNSTTYTNQNIGKGTQTQQNAFLPAGNLLQTATGQLLCAHGASSVPFMPVCVASVGAGTLDPAKTYSYGITVSMPDENGNEWRSPMSLTAAIVPGGGNNTVTVSGTLTPLENQQRRRVVFIWRTDGDASTYKLLHVIDGTVASTGTYSFVDETADVDTGQEYQFQTPGDPNGELEATLTPALIHPVEWNGRLWGIDRDFPTRVRFSKPLTTGLLPEFPDEFVVEIDDSEGPGTGLVAMDDKIVLLKESAIYIAGGEGPANDGTGTPFSFQLISSETGALIGSPILSTGAEVYMVASGGVFRLRRSQETDFIGAAIDRYLSMPLLTSPETVTGMFLSSEKNEVRVQTTNYRFVHDRIFDVWERDTGGMSIGTIVMTRPLNGKQAFFLSDGQMWVEADDSNTPTDAGTEYEGTLRAPWMRPANMEGWINLSHVRALGEVIESGAANQPSITIYFDNDDTRYETFAPRYQVGSAAGPLRADCKPRQRLCTAFSPQLTLPAGDATVRFDAWSALVALEPEMQTITNRDNWGPVPVVVAEPPPPAPPGPLPTPMREYAIAKLVSQQLGTSGQNSRDLLVQVKNAMLASGQWVLTRSCNGSAISTSDLWLTWNDLQGLGGTGGYSWLTMRNVATSVQLMIGITVTNVWTEIQIHQSPSVGFTGGNTLGVFPSASDSVSIGNPVGSDWLGTFAPAPDNDPEFRAFVWTSTDGLVTRVGWFYAGKTQAFWDFSSVVNPAAGTWVPWCSGMYDAGNDFVHPGRLGIFVYATSAHVARTNTANNEAIGGFLPFAGSGDYLVNVLPQNQASGQYLWDGPMMWFVSGAPSGRNGPVGFTVDQWWLGTVGGVLNFTDGDTINGGQFVMLGQMMMPWDFTLNPPMGGAPTTDYPSTQFFGRTAT